MHAPLASGTLLDNRYRIVGVAKRGALGQTYLARDQKQLNELCVLKEFIPTQQDPAVVNTLLQMFHKEAAPLYELRHPQLPRPRAMITQGNRFYWIREYVEGKSYGVTLDNRRTQGQVFSEAEVTQLLMQILPVLTYLHSRGVIHGNISLDTLILRQKDQTPVLIGYGLLRDLVMRLQLHPVKPEEMLPPWGFVPPEKLQEGKLYPNSDLYSLGVVAIALLTGKTPEELYNQQTQSFDWESSAAVNPKFARILRQMLEARPQKRFASATQVMQALEPLVGYTPAATAAPVESVSAVSEPVGVPESLAAPAIPKVAKKRPRPKKRGESDPRASAALVVGLAMLVGVAAWKVLSSVRSTPSPTDSSPPPVAVSPVAEPSHQPTEKPSPAPPKVEKATTSTNSPRQRLQSLGVDTTYFTNLTNELFEAKNPQANPQNPSSKEAWNATANSLMDRLETLPPEARKKLGTYQREDYDRWLTELGEGGKKNSPTLDALADGQLFKLFPELKGKTLNPRTTGQLWYAIAEGMVDNAKAKKAGKPT